MAIALAPFRQAAKPHTHKRRVKADMTETWKVYKADLGRKDLRNRLVEEYLPLVKYNAERIHAKLPEEALRLKRRLKRKLSKRSAPAATAS